MREGESCGGCHSPWGVVWDEGRCVGIAVKGKRVGASASSESGISAFTARASGGADANSRWKRRASARWREV